MAQHVNLHVHDAHLVKYQTVMIVSPARPAHTNLVMNADHVQMVIYPPKVQLRVNRAKTDIHQMPIIPRVNLM